MSSVKRKNSTQFKAFLLLVVFTSNMLVGFACAVGLGIGLNADHHSLNNSITSSIGHHHDEGKIAHHNHHKGGKNPKKSSTDNNCCNNDVIKFAQLDKLLAQAENTSVEAPAILVHFHFLYLSYLSPFTQRTKPLQVVRPYVESSRGIRVSIQSFQI